MKMFHYNKVLLENRKHNRKPSCPGGFPVYGQILYSLNSPSDGLPVQNQATLSVVSMIRP